MCATPTATSGIRRGTDDIIISAGYNIAGPEVENVLLEHPAVLECARSSAFPTEERGPTR
jgi:2-aminobenzoate-CoA ligase